MTFKQFLLKTVKGYDSFIKMVDKEFYNVVLGKAPADLLIEDASFLNPISEEIYTGSLAISRGMIAGWGNMPAKRVIRGEGCVVSPGLIDAHIHIESSMLSPFEFAHAVIAHGTTAVVADPHEVANVAGLEGIQWMMEQGSRSPLRFFWAAPSCVPASPLDTPGYVLGISEIETLLDMEEVVCLGEVMNYPGVIYGDELLHAKITAARKRGIPIDGHAPGLSGRELFAYLSARIDTDHECTTIQEAEERLRLGMLIQMRQGSSAHNLDTLIPLIHSAWVDRLMFATDDKNPLDLSERGHLDEHLRMCVRRGIPPAKAIRLTTLHPARHYRLRGIGSLAPGSQADLVFFKDLKNFEVFKVIIGGEIIYEEGRFLGHFERGIPPPSSSMNVKGISAAALQVRRKSEFMKVIDIHPGQLQTAKEVVSVPPGELVLADPDRDILKIAVIERHHGTGRVGLGFVRGIGIKRGAIATTVAHDSHHLIVVGTNDEDMLCAAKSSIEMGGGIVVASDREVISTLPLPLYGLMSDQPLARVTERFREVREAVHLLGSTLPDPMMQLSFLALPVIPSLKITDQGLVDVAQFRHVPLFGE